MEILLEDRTCCFTGDPGPTWSYMVLHGPTSHFCCRVFPHGPAAQVMSAMVGTLPDAFTNEFLSLTDHLPISRIEEVYRIIQRTFQQPPKVRRELPAGGEQLIIRTTSG